MAIGDHWTSRCPRVHIGMTSCVKRQAPLLLALESSSPRLQSYFTWSWQGPPSVSVWVCTEHSQGNVKLKPSDKARLTKYRQNLGKVADKRVSLKVQDRTNGRFRPPPLFWLLYWHHWLHHSPSTPWGGLARKAAGGLLQGVLDKI